MTSLNNILGDAKRSGGGGVAGSFERGWRNQKDPGAAWKPRTLKGLSLVTSLLLLAGCATSSVDAPARRFEFSNDTFSYANGLVWEYRYDEDGKWVTRRREPPPTYSQHCFVVSRSACQFFQNAIFKPELPKADLAVYRRRIKEVVTSSLRTPLPQARKIVIPGYADLRSFSADHEKLLQAECGGAWRCYFQRGNWRVVFPFGRSQQAHMAEQIQEELKERGATVVHLVRFPQLTINHAVLMFEAKPSEKTIEFTTYDPNDPGNPATVTYDRATKTFSLPANAYFQGGRVDVYPIYDHWLY
jgi:hypothetical protein